MRAPGATSSLTPVRAATHVVPGPQPMLVAGGADPIRAELDDLARAAERLGSAAVHLAGLGARLTGVLAASRLDPLPLEHAATRAAAELGSTLAVAGPHGLAPGTGRLAALSVAVRSAAVAYRGADAATDAAVRSAAPEGALAALPLLAGVVTSAAAHLGLPGEGSALQVRVSSPMKPGRAPQGVADIVDRIARVYPDATADPDGTVSPEGTVRVERVTSASGGRAWIVAVPGVQTWAPRPGGVPTDLTAAVRSLAGRTDTSEAVLVGRALEEAGARPGEPVLLAGHSLGGMVATNLAADPAFRRRFTVTHVVTVGSPAATAKVPSSVQVLSVEHAEDLVPRLDGSLNRAQPSWTTVTAPTPVPRVGGASGRMAGSTSSAGGFWSPHDVDAYVATARRIDASTDPALAGFRRGLAPFLDRDGVDDAAIEVTGRRGQAEPPAGLSRRCRAAAR